MFLFNEIFCPEYDCEIIWSLLSQSVAKVHNWYNCIGIKQNCLSASSGNIYVSILYFHSFSMMYVREQEIRR